MSWQEYDHEYSVPRAHFRFGPKLTPTVKALIIVNVVVFILQLVMRRRGVAVRIEHLPALPVEYVFCVVPRLLIRRMFIWQLFTYMFLHGNLWHILVNMFVLWMFGSDVEGRLGRREFLQLYFLSGVGAGLCHTVASWGSRMPMLGASGAVFGVLLAFAMLFPDRYLILFPFPMFFKAKHLVLGYAFITVLAAVLSAPGDQVAHFAHLGGFVFGYIYMRSKFRLSLPYAFAGRLSDALKRRWYWRKPPRHKYKPIDSDEFISEEVDPILSKISRHGIGSLTRKEKKILKRARSQME